MSGPFARCAQDYASREFSPLPITAGTKRPGYAGPSGFAVPMSKWQGYCERAMTPAEIARISRMDPNAGLGLACGFNGLVAVDVDNEKAYAAVREVFGGIHPPTKIGRKGATAFFNSKGAKIESRKFCEKPVVCTDGKTRRPVLVEILSTGNQTVIPDTVHPDTGKPYRWVHASLVEVKHPRDLPVITAQHIADLKTALAPFMPAKTEADKLSINPKKSAADLSGFDRRRCEGFARTALRAECEDLARQCKPGRNDAVFRVGCLLGRWVWHGILPPEDLESAVKAACETNKLVADNSWRDVLNTLKDGLARAANDSLPDLDKLRAQSHRRPLSWAKVADAVIMADAQPGRELKQAKPGHSPQPMPDMRAGDPQ